MLVWVTKSMQTRPSFAEELVQHACYDIAISCTEFEQ